MAENLKSSDQPVACFKPEPKEEMEELPELLGELQNNSPRTHMGITAFIKSNAASDVIIHSYRDGRHFICCKACTSYPELVKQYSYKRRLPPIATIRGTIFRRETLTNHLKTTSHVEANKAFKLASVQEMVPQELQLEELITKENEVLANQIGSLMLMLHNDAKRLKMFNPNWQSQVANSFQFRDSANEPEPEVDVEFPQILSDDHQELLECIVESHSTLLIEKLQQSLATSLRCDGFIDASCIDKIFVTCTVFFANGTQEQIFLGATNLEERGARGVFQALKESISYNLTEDAILALSDSLTAIVTDGTNMSFRDHRHLWDMIDEELNYNREKPCLKSWCTMHRQELIWQTIGTSVAEVTNIFQRVVNLFSYFRVSKLRSRELRKTTKQLKLESFPLPEVKFDSVWSDFSYSLLNAVLISWHPLASYLKQVSKIDKVAKDHLNFLIDLDQLELLTFLADLTFVYQRFHRNIQKDSVSIFEVEEEVAAMCDTIHVLKTQPLSGGWQNAIQEMLQEDEEGEVHLKGFKLKCLHHPNHRDINVVQCDVTTHFLKFLHDGFAMNISCSKTLKAFIQLDLDQTNIEEVHKTLVPEMALSELRAQFEELCLTEDLKTLTVGQLVKRLAIESQRFKEMLMALSRILALKPQPYDVESILNSNKILMDSVSDTIETDTKNLWLFIHHNLPPIKEWNPRPSVLTWFRRQQHKKDIFLLKNNSKDRQYISSLQDGERQVKKARQA